MSLHLLDLRPLTDLSAAVKMDMPVSIAMQPDGTPWVVSRYHDPVWDWYPYITNENVPPCSKRINWDIDLLDGRCLTDCDHADLLESTKDFIWSLFADPVEGRKRPSMATLRNKVLDITPLLQMMVSEGIRNFSGLAGRTLDYVSMCRIGIKGKPVAPVTVGKRLIVVEDLYHQRGKIRDALTVHPWPHESAMSLAGMKKGAGFKPKTEVIPDPVACHLADEVLDYVRNRSERILAAMTAAREKGETLASAGYSRSRQIAARVASTRRFGFEGGRDLIAEAKRLRTACYIVIDMFSGIRDSEMMSLAENCLAHGKSKDGSTDLLWLHGTIYKTGVRPKRWIVPAAVQEAIAVLMRLTAPLRQRMQQEQTEIEARIHLAVPKERARLVKRLDTVRKHKDKLFLSPGMQGGHIAVLSGTAMGADLKSFCADLGILGEDGQPYPLHAHQFRRTYARFVARAELGDLLTLRDHFGHWSIDMTVCYADGGPDTYEADVELLEMIAEEKMNRQNEILGTYLDSDTPLANGGHWLNSWRSSVRTAPNKEALIAEYAGTITLNGTGHSWCVGNAKGTGCGGLCVFEAQMCVDCNYGIIGPEHRPVWEGIRNQQLEALALDDMGVSGRTRAQQILEYAEKVLHRLDVQEVNA